MEEDGGVEVGGDHGPVAEEVGFDDGGVLGVGGAFGDGAVDYVCEDEGVGGVLEEFFGEELADEAAGSCDEDLHGA